MNDFVDIVFENRGIDVPAAGPVCPSDGLLASYLDGGLPVTEGRALEVHVLRCPACHDLVKHVIGVRVERTSTPARAWRAAARLLRDGLELLEPLGAVLRPAPALDLGAIRGASVAEEAPTSRLTLAGPGHGLDELELQLLNNGQVKLVVRSHGPLPVAADEVSSVVLEVDGTPREKRPYTGEALGFAPLGRGEFTLRLVTRAPGEPARDLSTAILALQA